MSDLECRRCKGAMGPGWLLENINMGHRYNQTITQPTLWIGGEAEPVKDQWGSAESGSYEFEGREVMQTFAYRCGACGLLEIYAQPIVEHYVRP